MKKILLNIDENLASSIALRYIGQLAEILPLQVQVIHVEEPDPKQKIAGTGWVQKTWEKGIEEAGMQTVLRLIKTENPSCDFPYRPKIFVGNKEDNILDELRTGYDLFLEGNLNTSNVNDFFELITSRLYRKTPCPALIVKNFVTTHKGVLLVGDGVPPDRIAAQFMNFSKNAKFEFELFYYKFQESDKLAFQDKSEGGSNLAQTENLLMENGCNIQTTKVISGTPEQAAALFREYGLAFSTFPTRKSPLMELLAHIPTPLLLCR